MRKKTAAENPVETRRYMGIVLGGAKNQKTAMSVLEYYPKEQKVFLLDIYEGIGGDEGHTGDEALLSIINESALHLAKIAVNVPLELPPCVSCTRKTCPMPSHCTVPAVKWMRDFMRKQAPRDGSKEKEFTPYTQRPVELWIRHHVMPQMRLRHPIDLDETLGGTKAPLVARMHFLKRHLPKADLIEVNTKLNAHLLGQELGLANRLLEGYRHLDRGGYARSEFLEAITQAGLVFVYDRDQRKLSQNLSSFDSFICAYSALLEDQEKAAPAPDRFPTESGWTSYPHFKSR